MPHYDTGRGCQSVYQVVPVYFSLLAFEHLGIANSISSFFRAKFQVQLDENGLTTAISNLQKETEAAVVPENEIVTFRPVFTASPRLLAL